LITISSTVKNTFLLILSFFLLVSCARRRQLHRLMDQGIRTMAILPVQFQVVGNMPKKIPADQYRQMMKQQGQFLYQSLYIDLNQQAHPKTRRRSQLQIQSLERTLELLRQQSISDSSAASMDPVNLAQLLQVDAVLITQVTYNRIMSSEAALGVDVIGGILNEKLPRNLPVWAARTGDLFVSTTLINKGYAVWSNRFSSRTDWNRPNQQAMQFITYRIARNFPL
jgi:hypothetical protein